MDQKNQSPHMEGLVSRELGGGVTQQSKLPRCTADGISNLAEELRKNGLQLGSVATDSQRTTLLKVLQYLGPRGLRTPEGTALGYMRLATRIQELEEQWQIASLRETIIGEDGLVHPGVARYVLLGRRKDALDRQGTLDLEVPA